LKAITPRHSMSEPVGHLLAYLQKTVPINLSVFQEQYYVPR